MTLLPTIEQIKLALGGARPGLTAWARMMPQPRTLIPPADRQPREAGVLLLLYPLDEVVHLVLTRRTEGLATHSGQISLPGGGVKPGETPTQAALREAEEELGISRHVDVLGELTPLYIPPSNYLIHPLVAISTNRPIFIPDPREVAEVVEVPLSTLLAAETMAEEVWELRGVATRVPFYRFGKHKVWGATAMVLAEFTVLLESVTA
jgi:8-oxo-dGTP pyrophosphatase MutT (NUDIX family)